MYNYHVQWADLQRRSEYRIEVHGDNVKETRASRFAVYIDWNQDGRFDGKGEMVVRGAGRNSASGDVAVPRNAIPGSTRMRVVLASGRTPGPCEMDTFSGEVEDYTVGILP
jgi:hypothetical protein